MRYALLRVRSGHGHLVRHAAFVSSVVLAMHWLVVTIREDSDGRIRNRLLQARLHGWAMRRTRYIIRFLFLERACALPTMVAATPLFLGDSGEVCWILLSVVVVNIARLCPLFGFT